MEKDEEGLGVDEITSYAKKLKQLVMSDQQEHALDLASSLSDPKLLAFVNFAIAVRGSDSPAIFLEDLVEGEMIDWTPSSFPNWVQPDPLSFCDESQELLSSFEASFATDQVESVDAAIKAILESGDPDLLIEVTRGCTLDDDGFFMTGPHFPFPYWADSLKPDPFLFDDYSQAWDPWGFDSTGQFSSDATLPHYALLRLMGHLTEDERFHPSLRKENVRRLHVLLPGRLPPEIGAFRELEELHAPKGRLKRLPDEIGQCEKLKILRLDGNELVDLPPEVGGLNELQYLGLQGNSLTELSSEIGQLAKLRVLDLVGNPLASITPEIWNLKKLQFMGLPGKDLADLLEKMIP